MVAGTLVLVIWCVTEQQFQPGDTFTILFGVDTFHFSIVHMCDHPLSSKFDKHCLELFFVLHYDMHKCLRKYRESTLRTHAFIDTTGIAVRSLTRFSVKRKLQPKRCHASMTRFTFFKRLFFNRVDIIGNSTYVL